MRTAAVVEAVSIGMAARCVTSAQAGMTGSAVAAIAVALKDQDGSRFLL